MMMRSIIYVFILSLSVNVYSQGIANLPRTGRALFRVLGLLKGGSGTCRVVSGTFKCAETVSNIGRAARGINYINRGVWGSKEAGDDLYRLTGIKRFQETSYETEEMKRFRDVEKAFESMGYGYTSAKRQMEKHYEVAESLILEALLYPDRSRILTKKERESIEVLSKSKSDESKSLMDEIGKICRFSEEGEDSYKVKFVRDRVVMSKRLEDIEKYIYEIVNIQEEGIFLFLEKIRNLKFKSFNIIITDDLRVVIDPIYDDEKVNIMKKSKPKRKKKDPVDAYIQKRFTIALISANKVKKDPVKYTNRSIEIIEIQLYYLVKKYKALKAIGDNRCKSLKAKIIKVNGLLQNAYYYSPNFIDEKKEKRKRIIDFIDDMLFENELWDLEGGERFLEIFDKAVTNCPSNSGQQVIERLYDLLSGWFTDGYDLLGVKPYDKNKMRLFTAKFINRESKRGKNPIAGMKRWIIHVLRKFKKDGHYTLSQEMKECLGLI